MKNSFLFRLVLVLGFVLGGSWLSAAPNTDLSGRVVFVDGDVSANGRAVDIGDLLVGPTLLKTGTAASVEMVFGGRNVFRLGPDSILKIDFSELQKTVTLSQGVFTSVLKKLAQATGAAPFLLKTPTANAGVRGTSFHVQVEGNQTYFCTCNGSVVLDDGTPAQQIDLTNAHHGARIFAKQADGSVAVKEAGLVGHSDASIVTLAQRIGVDVDWTKPDLDHGQSTN